MKNYFPMSEFIAQGFPANPSQFELFLLKNLRDNILNPIRAEIGKPCYLSDCYRTIEKYLSLKKSYNPSPTSDHFFGQAVPTGRATDVKKFGSVFSYSVGAVDCYFRGLNMDQVFKTVLEMARGLAIRPGQVILETNPATGFKWIHISNHKDLVYSDRFIYDFELLKNQYLVSTNNGRTYRAAA
jgi:hypothetical protein